MAWSVSRTLLGDVPKFEKCLVHHQWGQGFSRGMSYRREQRWVYGMSRVTDVDGVECAYDSVIAL